MHATVRGFNLVFIMGVALAACGKSSHSQISETQSVIGNDDRRVERNLQILSKVGTLDLKGQPICTAFASGQNNVTTAGHCFSETPDSNHYTVTIDNRIYPVKEIKIASKSDTASLIVQGVEEYFEAAEVEENEEATVVVFSIEDGKVMSAKGEKLSRTVNPSFLNYQNDTISGSSGAPILQNNKVVGIHLGTIAKHSTDSTDINFGVVLNEIQTADVAREHYVPECHSLNPFCGGGVLDFGQSTVAVCGVNMSVPTVSYALCAANAYLLPAGCTLGTAISAGGICAVNITLVAAACSVSVAKISEIAIACTK